MPLFTSSKAFSTVLKCEAGLVYEILTDYDSYFEWLPFIAYSKLLAREGDLAIAEFELFTPSHAKVAVECIHTKNRSVLIRRISGESSLRQILWSLSADGGQTQVSLKIERQKEWKGLLGLSRSPSPRKFMEALQSRVTTFSSEFLLGEESGRKLLEVFETDQGLDLWILGKKYVLQPAPEEKHD